MCINPVDAAQRKLTTENGLEHLKIDIERCGLVIELELDRLVDHRGLNKSIGGWSPPLIESTAIIGTWFPSLD